MGFYLGLLYFITYYLTPTVVFGPLAPFRIELILAVLVLAVSVPALSGAFVGKTFQSLALGGLAIAVILSILIGKRFWIGGATEAFQAFIPNAFAYFLICLFCNSKKKLQIVVFMLLCVCFFVIANGVGELQGSGEDGFPYQLAMKNSAGEWFFRLRGLGEINDPNDFAQLIACVIPLVFIFWRRKSAFRNLFCVLLPAGILIYGAFLTHSRGAMLAILATAVVACRRRIGLIPSLILGGGGFAAATALNFAGGRDISASAGSDRTELWSTGLQLLKSHPIFGIGFNNFADYAGLTAHNSLVVCAAELGGFGLFFWSLFLFTTLRDATALASPAKVTEGEPVVVEKVPFPLVTGQLEVLDKAEINRLGRLMILSFTGFLVAAWFLSRAFVMTFFLLGGMVEVIYEMALRQGMIEPRWRLGRTLRYTLGLAVLLILVMYITLRTVNLMH